MTAAAMIEVIEPGLLTTVQDAIGRWQSRRYGVSVGGAVDAPAARAANAAVGNAPEAALLEVTWDGPVLRFHAAATIAVAGAAFELAVDDRQVSSGIPVTVEASATLRFGDLTQGARAYLAVRGGIDVPIVLGSRSTDLRGRFGGLDGRPLRTGDRLAIGREYQGPVSAAGLTTYTAARDAPIRVLPGPHLDRFDHDLLDALCAVPWTVSARADRMGCRLEGAPLARGAVSEMASFGLPSGAIQVPGDGRPIVLLADHQPTGGYPVPAVVIGVDIGVVAQRLPGDEIRFGLVTHAEAVEALRATSERHVDGRRAAGERGHGR